MDSIIRGNARSGSAAGLIARSESVMTARAENFWHVVNLRRPRDCKCPGCRSWREIPERFHEEARSLIHCRFAYIAWALAIPNLVTTEGKNDLLTNYLKGSGYTATFYVALVDNASFTAYAAGDVAAQINGTNGWRESTAYSNANRVTWTGGTASGGSIDNSASQAAFNINATATIRGSFLITNSTKGGTTGKLYGEADFATARAVLSGDTLNVTITCTV